MLFSQTVSLIFLLAPSALATKYEKVSFDMIKTAPSVNVGVDCETHVYTGLQLRKLAFKSLRLGNMVNYCREKIRCMKKIDYRSKTMGYVTNSIFPTEAYYIRIRSGGSILKERFAKNNVIVVTKDGTILGVLTQKDKAWVNCPNRQAVGLIRPEQEADVRKANQKILSMKDAKPVDTASAAEMKKHYPAESEDATPASRGAASPRAPSSPRVAENLSRDSAPVTDPSTSGEKE